MNRIKGGGASCAGNPLDHKPVNPEIREGGWNTTESELAASKSNRCAVRVTPCDKKDEMTKSAVDEHDGRGLRG